MDYQSSYKKRGYAHFTSIFSEEEMARLRASADRITDTPSDFPGDLDKHPRFGTSRSDIYSHYPEFQWVLFHPPLIEAIKALLGSPVVFIPEQSLQKDFYSNWHRDTSAPRRDKQTFYLSPNFRVVQVAIYLQDNSTQFGGGLDVVPGSHREVHLEWLEDLGTKLGQNFPWPFKRGRDRLKQLFTLPARLAGKFRKPLSLPIRAGDVVAFDLRIKHRATPNNQRDKDQTQMKYGLFLVCSSDNEIANEYLYYARDFRKNEAILNHQFPDSLKQKAAKVGVILV
jgi:hypothetical protein